MKITSVSKTKKKKLTAKEKFKRKLKKDLTEGFRQIKLHQEGKIKLKSARELLDEL